MDTKISPLDLLKDPTLLTTANLHLAERKLRPIFPMEMAIKVKAHFAVYPPRHSKRKPVEAFLTWLHHEAARQNDGI